MTIADLWTLNDDFTDQRTDIHYLLRTFRPVGVATQESKGTDYREQLGDRYGVRQRMHDDATQGVGVIWDRERARSLGRERDNPAGLGGGWLPLLERERGDDFLTRGIVWQDLLVVRHRMVRREIQAPLRLASCHRLPGRDSDEWPAFDRALAAWAAASPIPVWIGMDCNERGGPKALIRRTGLAWHGAGLDGGLTNVPVQEVLRQETRHSDHPMIRNRTNLKRSDR